MVKRYSKKTQYGSSSKPLTDTGVPVSIKDTKENWSECTLEDGTVLRVKPIIMEVRKLHVPDADGNPGYSVRSTLITDVQLKTKTKK